LGWREARRACAAGANAGFSDEDFTEAGATIGKQRATILKNADIVLRVRKPSDKEIDKLKEGGIHVSFLDPFNEAGLLKTLCAKKVTGISMEMIPRSTSRASSHRNSEAFGGKSRSL